MSIVDEVACLYRFGWLCSISKVEVDKYLELYNNIGVHGATLDENDVVIRKLIEWFIFLCVDSYI